MFQHRKYIYLLCISACMVGHQANATAQKSSSSRTHREGTKLSIRQKIGRGFSAVVSGFCLFILRKKKGSPQHTQNAKDNAKVRIVEAPRTPTRPTTFHTPCASTRRKAQVKNPATNPSLVRYDKTKDTYVEDDFCVINKAHVENDIKQAMEKGIPTSIESEQYPSDDCESFCMINHSDAVHHPKQDPRDTFCKVEHSDAAYPKQAFHKGEVLAKIAYKLAKGDTNDPLTVNYMQTNGLTCDKIHSNHNGLVAFLLSPQKPQGQNVNITVTFRGTQLSDENYASAKRDLEGFRGGVGHKSLTKNFPSIEQALEKKILSLPEGTNVTVTFAGHSLGGADVNTATMLLLKTMAKRKGNHPIFKRIVQLNIHTKNAPGVPHQTITRASEYLQQLHKQAGSSPKLQVNAYYQQANDDIIQSFGAGYIFSQPTDLQAPHVNVHLLVSTKQYSTLQKIKFAPHRDNLFIKNTLVDQSQLAYFTNQGTDDADKQKNIQYIHKAIGFQKATNTLGKLKNHLFRKRNKIRR